ncbi:MAG: 16S rRNA (guanine(527)-N(7))-methyltransferase RsmG [Ruminococcaceae bacterium]|nr:16S rRNA (guanine(527)-N(7))-methyltransferase RsmG [Oscillospiraceae bacterium]
MLDFEQFSAIFHTVMALNGLSEHASAEKAEKFYRLTAHMLETNEKMNLTAIKEEEAVILLHYADSLTASAFLPQNAKIADIGCGAGFPCLPLAICRPDLSILGIDSTEKRIRYVEETAAMLGCSNLSAVAMRAEEGGKGSYRERFDVCTARAVAALPLLAELCLPYVKLGGTFLAMKGKKGEEELQAAATAIKRLGGELAALHPITLRHASNAPEETRYLIEIKKIAHTPAEFPRAWGKILKKPL